MTVEEAVQSLIRYGIRTELIEASDARYAANGVFDVLGVEPSYAFSPEGGADLPLEEILGFLLDDAVKRGRIEDGIASRDLFDTRIMGVLTPRPSEVIRRFTALEKEDPVLATDYFYKLAGDSDYIRRYRIAKDVKWVTPTRYGDLDITINLSKPEKDPKAIAAALKKKQDSYPKCLLCPENEGYAGRMDHPARETIRLIPMTLGGEKWYMQYSPYVYYNEHCIVLCSEHRPMKVDIGSFRRLLDFVGQFPHYFLGSNADLPIVGGSILSHDHFQGGRYEFAMAKAPIETAVSFPGFEDVEAGIVRWPMSVLRLTGPDRERLALLADRILAAWRGYSDESVFVFAETEGQPHNTITPIARRRGENYQLDLVLRNNITTEEHPLGVFHPHAKLHHIKKENIGLIEVMGLAVLPSRLKQELNDLREAILAGRDLRADEELSKHADWVDELRSRYSFTSENTESILRDEVGRVFEEVLEDAGVFKRDAQGQAAFLRFVESVK